MATGTKRTASDMESNEGDDDNEGLSRETRVKFPRELLDPGVPVSDVTSLAANEQLYARVPLSDMTVKQREDIGTDPDSVDGTCITIAPAYVSSGSAQVTTNVKRVTRGLKHRSSSYPHSQTTS